MKKNKFALAALLLIAAVGQATASTNLVVNGSFEDGISLNSNGIATFSAASQGLTGWLVGLNTVDVVNGQWWNASSGSNSLDLSGLKKGEIHQVLNTTAGQLYQLSFDMAGNVFGGPAVKKMSVNVGSSGVFSFDNTGTSATNMGWATYTSTFIATASTTTLSFLSNTAGNAGPALDNISVTAVPEPESYAMFLAGLGIMGAVARRRSKKA